MEGAEIWVVPLDSSSITRAGRQAGPAAVTGRDGHFELGDRSVGDHEKLRACRKGFVPAEFQAQDPETGEPRVALTPSTQIAGKVMNVGGDPLPGMSVSASLSGQTGTDLVLPDPPCPFEDSATTDAEGAFALELKGPGRYDVTAIGPGYLLAKQDHVLVPPEGLEGMELQMDGGAVVLGHLYDPESHSVAGATLSVSGSRSFSHTFSDSGGNFLLEGVSAGDSLLIEHPDFETAAVDIHVPSAGMRLNLMLLSPKSRLEARGRVTDPDGVPVEGAIVTGSGTRTATLADGSFAVRVDKGAGRLVAEKEGFAATALDVKVENRSLEGLEIRLGHGLTLRGRVLGVDPAAVTESCISVSTQNGETLASIDSAGQFEVHNLPSEEWSLSARAGDRQAEDLFTPPPGQPEVVHDLEFAPAFEVWGRITGPGGELIAGASLQLASDHHEQFHAQTRLDGSFTLEVPDGTYTLSASADGYAGREADQPVVVAGAPVGNVELQLGTNIILTGRLLGLERGDTLKALQVEGPRAFHPGPWTVDQDANYRQTALGREIGRFTRPSSRGIRRGTPRERSTFPAAPPRPRSTSTSISETRQPTPKRLDRLVAVEGLVVVGRQHSRVVGIHAVEIDALVVLVETREADRRQHVMPHGLPVVAHGGRRPGRARYDGSVGHKVAVELHVQIADALGTGVHEQIVHLADRPAVATNQRPAADVGVLLDDLVVLEVHEGSDLGSAWRSHGVQGGRAGPGGRSVVISHGWAS